MWLTCFLTVSRLTTSSRAMPWFDRPGRQQPQHLQLAAGQRVDDALRRGAGAGPVIGRGRPGVEGTLQPGQAVERDLGRGLAGSLGRDQPAQQRGHRRALVGEEADITLRAGDGERLGQGVHRSLLLAAGGQRQCPQRADLDQAPGPVLGGRRRVQPVQQRQRPLGLPPGEQDPGQHQVPRLPWVDGIVVRSEAATPASSGRPQPDCPGPAAAVPAAPERG